MYLLKKRQGISSLTWCTLVDTARRSRRKNRTEHYHSIMRRVMGDECFRTLERRLRQANLVDYRGEPDLFCWHPNTAEWFFAEAKRADTLLPHQLEWFRVCREAVPGVDIRVYRLDPQWMS
jgi:hypothetical protein